MALLRRRGGGGGGDSLPLTLESQTKRSSLFQSPSSTHRDGSASSIRLHHSLAHVWKTLDPAIKFTYLLLLVFLLMLYIGIQWIRYQNSHLHVVCHSQACSLSVRPVGWTPKVLLELPRRQWIDMVPIKVSNNGSFVSNHPNLHADLARPQQGKHPKSYATGNYKGPDNDGNYVSYALVLLDPQVENETLPDLPPLVSLDGLAPYVEYDATLYHHQLIARKIPIFHSPRRIKTIQARMEGYLKQRRSKLVVKEAGVVAWQGILCIVLGALGLLLTLLLGQLWTEDKIPSSKHHHHHHKQQQQRRSSPMDRYQRTTPARYEVQTKPANSSRATKR